jgi:hypothetical protein
VSDYEEIRRLKAEARNERVLASREAKIEAELERRMTPSERQARLLRPTRPAGVDSRPLSELSTDERQAAILRDQPQAH